jgi:hypothetical protein
MGTETTRVSRLALAFALALAPGCAFFEKLETPPDPWAQVRGTRSDAPPARPLARVLVLPIEAGDSLPSHAEAMRVAVAQSLRELCGFDVLAPERAEFPRSMRDDLAAGKGRDAAALIRLRREWGVDAVLRGRLAWSRPHGVPGVGLELELVDTRDGTKLWSAQDVVDAQAPAVRVSLLRFRDLETGAAPTDPAQVPLDSFARFVARSFVRTLYEPAVPTAVPAASPATTAAAPSNDAKVPGKEFPTADDR